MKNYFSLIKFSHTIFAMPFALIGFFLGTQYALVHQLRFSANCLQINPYVYLSLLVVLCMVFARSAAMAFNRYLDYQIDARNPRTAIREIPAGKISPNKALAFTIICALLFILCTFFINTLCFYLSFVALFVILFYSYTKRFTALCHLVLGLGLSLAPIGAFLAVTGRFQWLPLLFSLVVFTWVSGFDIIYALQDEEFDKSNQLYSIPAFLGKQKALWVSNVLHMITAFLIVVIGINFLSTFWYWIGAVIFMAMLWFQHRLVKPNDLSKVNIAFMTANGIASVVFAFFVIIHLIIQINKI